MLLWPREGDRAAVQGQLDLYPPRGAYQLLGSRIWPLGEGDQARAKALLEDQLEREGLFDPRLKRPLPPLPLRAGVITSPSGAAFHDVRRVAAERFPGCSLLWIPAQVQGVESVDSLLRALERARGVCGLDCLLLVRGGGSRDDLNPFDDERLVRALRQSPVPVVVGVGHEVDRTLADRAADVTAPTPSGAAERVFPDRADLSRQVRAQGVRLVHLLDRRLGRSREELLRRSRGLCRILELRGLRPREERLAHLAGRLGPAIRRALEVPRDRLGAAVAGLEARSPLGILARGYAWVQSPEGVRIREARRIRPGDPLRLCFRDGEVPVRAEGSHEEGSEG